MGNYFQPDSRWNMYEIKNREDHVNRVIVKGYFHNNVPQDVKKAFITAEYLMAHAYYHWEMFDEAFNKAFLIVEMGVKIKAQELGVPIDRKNKNGDRIPISLGKIIKKVCKPDFLGELKQRLQRAQALRNMVVHPKQHSFMGPNGTAQNIKYCVNLINRLFKDENWHKIYSEKTESIEKKINELNKGVLRVEIKQPAFLISTILSFELIDDRLVLNILPILNEYKSNDEEFDSEDPITLLFKDYEITKNHFSGVLTNGKTVTIKITDKPENLKVIDELDQYVKQLSKTQRVMREHSYSSIASWSLIEEEYNYYKDLFS